MLIDSDYMNILNGILFRVGFSGITDSIIAGGAIRDMLLEKEIADIDVFVKGDPVEGKLNTWFSSVEPCDNGLYEDSQFNVMFKCTLPSIPVPIQIIQVKGSIEQHINAFPCPLSRTHYDNEYGLGGVDKVFLEDVNAKRLRFDRKVNQQYVDKMVKKFPEYKIMYSQPEFAPHYASQVPF